MMFTKRMILFASIFAVVCATKEQLNDGGLITAESGITTNHIYSQPIQDNIAAESDVAKRGASVAAVTTSSAANSESQGQSSQIDGSSGVSGSNGGGVISFSTPNSFQQFFSPTLGQFGTLYAATLMPSSSGSTPQIFYVRAPQQYVTPSGVGTIKLTYTANQAQPQTSIQYASTNPKVQYAISPGQYLAAIPTTPNSYSYAPIALASPYTTNTYPAATAAATNSAPLSAASLQQGQIIPFTSSTSGLYLNPQYQSQLSQLQGLSLAVPQTVGPAAAAATAQPYTYTTATPVLSSVPKVGAVSPTAAAFYSAAPASQTYQQSPSFLSYQNAGLNYATSQKLVAVPAYTQATYRPFVAPTAATAATAYSNAYIQPTSSAPVKYTLAQPTGYYTAASGQTYQKLAYAPSSVSATSSPYYSSYPQSASQSIQSAQASNTNGAIQYASQLYQPNLNAFKYGYSQIPTAQKYFYASS